MPKCIDMGKEYTTKENAIDHMIRRLREKKKITEETR